MQTHLTALGLYKDKIDGKAGMLTRAALGAYQKSDGPQGRLLAERGGAAVDEWDALTLRQNCSPDERSDIRGRCQPNRTAVGFVATVPGVASLDGLRAFLAENKKPGRDIGRV